MKIALISPYKSIASHGIRSLSSYLKEKGIYVNVIFLCLEMDAFSSRVLCKRLIQLLVANNIDLIGISLSTNYFNIAKVITKYIKSQSNIPIIWGGIHPTIRPDECLKFADMVCLGYGEMMLVELCNRLSEGKDYFDVNNLCFKNGNSIKHNALGPLIQDIDLLPFPDYDLTGHFIWNRNDFYPMNEELFKKYQYIPDRYETLTSRGCPYQCSYCCNNTLQRLYGQKGFLRNRSPHSIVKELGIIKDKFPFIRSIYFDDDAIFSKSTEDIELFCNLYKELIGLPFSVSGIYPLALTREKLKLFVDAGLKRLKMGIQTGSESINSLYKRHNITKEKIIEVTHIINSFKDKLEPPIYDFILDNPYEKVDDLIETVNLIFQIPKPYELSLFSLTFFPENEMTEMALRDGMIKKVLKSFYLKDHNRPSLGYFNTLIKFLAMYKCPGWLQRVLINRILINLKIHFIFFLIIEIIFLISIFKILCIKLLRDLWYFDFSRIKRELNKYKNRVAQFYYRVSSTDN